MTGPRPQPESVELDRQRLRTEIREVERALYRAQVAGSVDDLRPMLRSSLVTAALLVFVDVMKELPATFVMRPFNFDTLAVQAYNLASDERLAEASTASLAIVAVGLLPVIIASRRLVKRDDDAVIATAAIAARA